MRTVSRSSAWRGRMPCPRRSRRHCWPDGSRRTPDSKPRKAPSPSLPWMPPLRFGSKATCWSARRDACRSRPRVNTLSQCTRMANPPAAPARTRAWHFVRRGGCAVEPGTTLAGEQSDTVLFDGVTPIARSVPTAVNLAERLRRMGATVRSQQMAGALEGCLEAVTPVRGRPSPVRPANREIPGGPAQPRGACRRGGGGHHLGRCGGIGDRPPRHRGRAHLSRRRHREDPFADKRRAPAPASPTRCTARWDSPASTASSTERGGCGRGATTSTPRRCGRSSWAGTSRSAGATPCGRRSPRGESTDPTVGAGTQPCYRREQRKADSATGGRVLRDAEVGIAREATVRRHAPGARAESRPRALEATPTETKVTRRHGPRRGPDVESTRTARR